MCIKIEVLPIIGAQFIKLDRAVIKIKLYRTILLYINHGTLRVSAEKCFQEDAIKIDGIFIKFSSV